MFKGFEKMIKEWKDIEKEWEEEKFIFQKRLERERMSPYKKVEEEALMTDSFHSRMKKIEERIKKIHGEEVAFQFLVQVGWHSQVGEYEWIEGIGAVDRSLVYTVKKLREMGYVLLKSCSGIQAEHKNKTKEGYIVFEYVNGNIDDALRLAALKTGMSVDSQKSMEYNGTKKEYKGQFIIRNRERLDWQKKIKWRRFLREVERIKLEEQQKKQIEEANLAKLRERMNQKKKRSGE